MSDNLQLNITIPKKGQESAAPSINSKQKRYEKYINRKKKRMEKNPKFNSVQHPRISKDFPLKKAFNCFQEEENQENNENETFESKKSFKTKSILKKFTKTQKNPEPIIEEPIQTEPEKPIYPTIFATKEFETMPINDHLKKTLQGNNYIQLTNIQQEAIPLLLTRSNSLIKSETGSGKTLCYLIPIYELLMQRVEKVQRNLGTLALILCPTRELCVQVDEEARKLSKAAIWVVNGSIMGGESIKKEKARLRKGINILISTPGRLVYHLQNSESFEVKNLEFLVLEESDRTLDMGFSRDVEMMIHLLAKRANNWDKVQKILISANFSQKIKTLTLKMTSKELKYIGWEQKPSADNETGYFQTEEMLKIPKSISQQYVLLKEEHKIAFLVNFLRKTNKSPQKIMIFVATIDEVEFFSYLLSCFEDLANKFKVYKLHGDIDQKSRTATYLDFKKKAEDFSVLIATDVASRGLDFFCVDVTILTSIPVRPIDYCNTIGRTGRIDQSGVSILMLYEQELKYLEELQNNGIDELKEYHRFNRNESFDNIRKQIVSIIKNNYEIKTLAKRAYVSFMRAYNRNQKGRFYIKALDLQALAKNFGIGGGTLTQDEEYKEGIIKRKDKNLEKNDSDRYIKKNVIRNVRELERMEFG